MKTTKEQIDFIIEQYKENDLKSLTSLFNQEFGWSRKTL